MKVSQIHRSKDSFWEYLPNQLWIITLRRFLLDKDVFIRRSELANSFGREFSAIRAMVRWNRQLKRKLWNGKFPEHQSLWWSKLFITLDTCLWFVLLNSFYYKPTDWAKIYYYYYYYTQFPFPPNKSCGTNRVTFWASSPGSVRVMAQAKSGLKDSIYHRTLKNVNAVNSRLYGIFSLSVCGTTT